jgi:hypothetical protein
MTARYASALEEIRAILAKRTQAEPLLEAADIWDELTCWPLPSLRTIRRFVEQIRAESAEMLDKEVGRDGQNYGHRGQTAQNGVVLP